MRDPQPSGHSGSNPLRDAVLGNVADADYLGKQRRPKSKKTCRKRHMKWNTSTRRCNKSKSRRVYKATR